MYIKIQQKATQTLVGLVGMPPVLAGLITGFITITPKFLLECLKDTKCWFIKKENMPEFLMDIISTKNIDALRLVLHIANSVYDEFDPSNLSHMNLFHYSLMPKLVHIKWHEGLKYTVPKKNTVCSEHSAFQPWCSEWDILSIFYSTAVNEAILCYDEFKYFLCRPDVIDYYKHSMIAEQKHLGISVMREMPIMKFIFEKLLPDMEISIRQIIDVYFCKNIRFAPDGSPLIVIGLSNQQVEFILKLTAECDDCAYFMNMCSYEID